MKLSACFFGLALMTGPGGSLAESPAVGDYAAAESWLCRPGRRDACTVDLQSTAIGKRGRIRVERFKPHRAPPIDCFYVYPTVSTAPGVSAPLAATEAEKRAVRQQFARFASVCRLYAPLYRQLTVEVLRRGEDGEVVEGLPQAIGLAERDVLAAWKHYLTHDNRGRGVVLIGHSQGANILQSLLAKEIDGKPVQKQLVSAILAGAFVEVATGKDVGGAFKSIPACRSASQIGCVIAFDTWRATDPPPENHRPEFEPGREALCSNPAALSGGAGVLKPYLSATGETIIPQFTARQAPWTGPPVPVRTPFVQLPELLWAECVDHPRGDYLAVSIRRAPGDVRRGDIAGDLIHRGRVADYGLHLIDLNLTAGNLLDVVRRQAAEYQRRQER